MAKHRKGAEIGTPPVTEKVCHGTRRGNKFALDLKALHAFLLQDELVEKLGEERVVSWRDMDDVRHAEPVKIIGLYDQADTPKNGQRLICFRTYEGGARNRYGIVSTDPSNTLVTEVSFRLVVTEIEFPAISRAIEISNRLIDSQWPKPGTTTP